MKRIKIAVLMSLGLVVAVTASAAVPFIAESVRQSAFDAVRVSQTVSWAAVAMLMAYLYGEARA